MTRFAHLIVLAAFLTLGVGAPVKEIVRIIVQVSKNPRPQPKSPERKPRPSPNPKTKVPTT